MEEKERKSKLDFSVLENAVKWNSNDEIDFSGPTGDFDEDSTVNDTVEIEDKTPVIPEKVDKKQKDNKVDTQVNTDDVVEDEDENEEEETDNTTTTPPVSTENIKIDPYLAFAQDLEEAGILEGIDAEELSKADDKDDYLRNKAAEKIVAGIEEYKSSLPAEITDLIELHEQGVALYTILEADKNIAMYSSIKPEKVEEDENLQKQLVRDLLVKKGFSDDKIQAKITRYENSGVLKEEGLDALEAIKEIQEEEKQAKIAADIKAANERQAAIDAQIEGLKKTIKDTVEIIPNIKLNEAQRKEILNGILNKDKQGLTKIQKVKKDNPLFDLQVATIATVFNGDFKKFVEAYDTKATTKVARKLKDALDTTGADFTNAGTLGDTKEKTSTVNKETLKGALKFLKKNNNF